MKINISADIHVGVPNRLDDIMWALRKMRQYNADNNIDTWLILGDLLHDRESLNIKDLCELVEFLEETDNRYNQKIISFPGNHDMFLKNSWDINSLKPLSRYIDCKTTVCKVNLGGIRFWILPFIHYESKYMKVLNKIEEKHEDGDVLLTHIGVKSATINTCFLLQSWSIVDFSNSPFDRIYTGHFHSKQQVGDNVWYPGSPIPFKFDEGDVDHGFFVFDTDTRTHEFVSIWHGGKDSDDPPQFITLDDNLISSKKSDEINGNMVRVALSKDYTHNQLSEIKDHLTKLGAKKVRWMHLASKEDKEGMKLAQKTASSASELLEQYVDADEKGTKDLNKSLLTKINKMIIAEGDRRYELIE